MVRPVPLINVVGWLGAHANIDEGYGVRFSLYSTLTRYTSNAITYSMNVCISREQNIHQPLHHELIIIT